MPHEHVGGRTILDRLRDWLEMYTWPEFWIAMTIPAVLTAVLLLFAYLLTAQNDIARTAFAWSFFIVLTLLAAAIDATMKQKSK